MGGLRQRQQSSLGDSKRARGIFRRKGRQRYVSSIAEPYAFSSVPSLTNSTCSESSCAESQGFFTEESVRSVVQWIDPVPSGGDTDLVEDRKPEKENPSIWVSKPARMVFINVLVALVLRQPVLLYGVLLIILRLVISVASSWLGFYSSDPEVLGFVKLVRFSYQRALKETDLAVKGSYSRQVMASYAFYACTAPGESAVSSILRYKMSNLNNSVVESLQEWRQGSRGYEQESTRTLA